MEYVNNQSDQYTEKAYKKTNQGNIKISQQSKKRRIPPPPLDLSMLPRSYSEVELCAPLPKEKQMWKDTTTNDRNTNNSTEILNRFMPLGYFHNSV
jgi:hypothetical protein